MTEEITNAGSGSGTSDQGLSGATSVVTGPEAIATGPVAESTVQGASGSDSVAGGENGSDKPAEDALKTEAELPPIEYTEFKFPENFEKDDSILQEFTGLAKEARLPQEQAQRLIDLGSKMQTVFEQKAMDFWKQTNEQWTDAVKADPEVGGSNLAGVQAAVSKTIDQYGGAEAKQIRDALLTTGAGNNPALVKYLYRMSKQLVEGNPTQGAPVRQVAKNAAAVMYPNQPV